MNKSDFSLIVKICERAEKLGYTGERQSLVMDLESACEAFSLRLQELLDADDLNFSHDINGIINNINREEFPAKDFNNFVPKFGS